MFLVHKIVKIWFLTAKIANDVFLLLLSNIKMFKNQPNNAEQHLSPKKSCWISRYLLRKYIQNFLFISFVFFIIVPYTVLLEAREFITFKIIP